MLQADKVPMTKTMWDDFHKSQPWVIDHFTLKADEIFKRYKVMGSAVQFGNGLRMSPDADGGSINQKNPQPWYFNSILMSFLVERQPNGLPQPNYQFLDDFVSLQKK